MSVCDDNWTDKGVSALTRWCLEISSVRSPSCSMLMEEEEEEEEGVGSGGKVDSWVNGSTPSPY